MPLRLLVAHTPAERDAARTVEAAVFLQAFGNTPEVMEAEYGPFEERSRFIVVLDEEGGTALGACRLVLADPAAGPVKTLVDVAGDPWHVDPDAAVRAAAPSGGPVWDVATLAVDRRFRSGAAGAEVTLALCHGLYRYSRNCEVAGWVTVLDDRVLRLQHMMGIPWVAMPGATSREYLGSGASTPCTCVIEDIAGSIRATRPELAPALLEGVLRSIAVDPDDLLPGRGELLGEPDPMPLPAPARRDTSGWRPPTARRAADPVA
ncbi:hypothetical protein [Blastococcus sp. SYSU D00813]